MSYFRICLFFLHIQNYIIFADINLVSNMQLSSYEIKALESGIKTHEDNHDNRPMRTKMLLCSTFVKADYQILSLLYNNMKIMENKCDWVVIFYDGDPTIMNEFCSLVKNNKLKHIDIDKNSMNIYNKFDNKLLYPIHLTLCKQANSSIYRNVVDITHQNGTIVKEKTSIPKSVLYQELLPVLTEYQKVFILDEDISLEGFGIQMFMNIW